MVTEFQPYVGPRPYERDDPAPFFGRDHEADELLSLIISYRELLFYAQSGTGKTSLLNARVIPLLEQERFEVLPVARVQGVPPQDLETAEIHNLYIFNTLMSWSNDAADYGRLAHMTLAEFLKQRKRPTDTEGQTCPRALIFDQFEELFAFYSDRWRDRKGFFEQVRDALEEDRRLRVIFSMREDYIAQLDPFASIMPEKMRTRFRLERLRRETALAAITGPLRSTKRSFAPGVAEKLVEDLQKTRVETVTGETVEEIGEFVEPVQLQVVCQNLWQELPPGVTQVTEEHLMAFGSVDRPLAKFYETAINAAATQTGIHESELRQWCEQRLIISPPGIRSIVHRGVKLTEGIPNEALDILEDRHLIRSEWRTGARWYELTHDRFVDPILASNKRWREQREEKVKNASLLLHQAEQATTINKYEQALDYAEKAYLLSEEIGDESGIVFAIIYQGKAYEGQKRYEKAKAAYEQACKLFDEMGDRSGKAMALQAIGNVLYNLAEQEIESDVQQARAKREKALESYEEARKLFHEVDDRPREASVLQAIGDVERIRAEQEIKSDGKEVRAEQDAALECYEQARKLFHEFGDRSGEAKVLLAIGNVQQSRAERQAKLKSYGKQFRDEQGAARRSYEQARELFQKVGDSKGVDNVQQAIKNVELRKSRGRIKLLSIALIALIIIVISGGILYATRFNPAQQGKLEAQAKTAIQNFLTAQAQATTADQNFLTAQAQATANFLTAQAASAQVQAIYNQAISGNPALYDPLSSNDTNNWDKGSSVEGDGCTFTGGVYHASISKQNTVQECFAKGTNFSNFAFQVQMTIIKGDGGGLIFRAQGVNSLYRFRIGIDGTYDLFIPSTGIHPIISNTSNPAIKKGPNQFNLLTVIASGNTILLFVNGQYLGTVSDSTYNSGEIGLFAFDFRNPTDVAFSNAELWEL